MHGCALTRACLTAVLFAGLVGARAESVVLTFDQPETAGISGFRAFWDRPVVLAEDGVVETVCHRVGAKIQLSGTTALWSPKKRKEGTLPGALVFDAVHRSLLVRFPGSAEDLAAKLAEGYRIEKAEIELPFINTELWPDLYILPAGMSFLRHEWITQPPNWHAVAWALRKPWTADAELGPTFNAAINGALYWSRFGAQDEEHDRFPLRFGPVEVSYRQATDYQGDAPPKRAGARTPDTPPGGTPARLDVTAALTDAAFGKTPAVRLRQFADCGVLIRKEEVYDARYHTGTYEWSTATGRRGILIRTPRLLVTLNRDAKTERAGKLPAPADIAALAQRVRGKKAGGAPTAVMPSAAEITALAERFGLKRPDWMEDWQWQRLRELGGTGGGFASNPDSYGKWIDELLACPPRQWLGHVTPRKAINALRLQEAWPAPVREHEFRYFESWIMPWMPTEEMDHPQAINLWYGGTNRHWQTTRDWRGNQSYYRAGYTRRISTQNINHLGTAGALFGGALVNSEYGIADGRYGLEHFPLRLWAWSDGTTQESIDHFYLPLTLWTQKTFADFGPSHLDRMMGKSALAKTLDEVVSVYHPGLRRMVATSGRTGIGEVLLTQTGLRTLLHSLSRSGALTDKGNTNTWGMPVMQDSNVSPAYVAREWLVGPWAPQFVANMVDEKPLPYEMTAVARPYPNNHKPEYRRLHCSYLGRHYGLASRTVAEENAYVFVPAMAQWRRAEKQVETLDEVVTMLVRPEADERCLDWYGSLQWAANPPIGGINANVQYRNILLALSSPTDMRKKPAPKSLQLALGLFNFQESPTWELYLDGQRVNDLPLTAKSSQRITIRDGVSFVGLIPVPGVDLGRDAEITVTQGCKVETKRGAFPGLTIRNYMLKRDEPIDAATADFDAIRRAYCGFVIEMGDATEFADFAAFQKHIAAATLDVRWDADANLAHIAYTSGTNTVEVGYNPVWISGPTAGLFPYRRVNGGWPWPGDGVDRDTTLTQQGDGGRLQKNGATLTCEPGRMAYLKTEPISGTVCGWNPLPDTTYWKLETDGGVRVEPDGRVGMLRVELQLAKKRMTVDYAVKAEQDSDDMSRSLLVFGMPADTEFSVNGAKLQGRLKTVVLGSETAMILPLVEPAVSPSEAEARYAAMEPLRDAAFTCKEPVVGKLRAESDTYLYTVPRSGVSRFQRMWPTESVIDARVPGGVRVATDGRVALLRMDIDKEAGIIDLDLPLHEQGITDMKAKALLIFGCDTTPSVIIQGKPWDGPTGTATIDGQTAYVVPLYGEILEAAQAELAGRFAEAQKKLAAAESR